MEAQTVEQTEKWREIRAAWVKRLMDKGSTAQKAEDYATWYTRVGGCHVPGRPEKPECGFYAVLSTDKTHWRPCCYQRDDTGTIVCIVYDKVNGGGWKGRTVTPADVIPEQWAKMWDFAWKTPLSFDAYKHLKDTGRLPGESEAASAIRNGNVIPITDKKPAAAENIPTGTEGRTVSKTDNNPPASTEITFETLMGQYELAKISADTMINKGAAKTKDEADQAADLADTFLKIEKKAKDLFEIEKAPHKDLIDKITAKWRPLQTGAGNLKSQLKTVVCTPFAVAEKKRLEEERAKHIAAGADPETAPSTKVAMGSGIGRRSAPQVRWKGNITDRAAFLAHVKDSDTISEALQSLADAYARNRIEPPPPGIEYKEVTSVV